MSKSIIIFRISGKNHYIKEIIMKILNRYISIILLIFTVYGLIPNAIFAQNNIEINPVMVNGFNRSVFDYHFTRADREQEGNTGCLKPKKE